VYEYNSVVTETTDGDTVKCTVDLGFGIYSKQVLRLLGINTPELHGVADPTPGLAAKAFLASLVEGKAVIIRTTKDRKEKYGRLLAEVFLPGAEKSVNQQMIDAGHAKAYFGGAR